MAPGMGENRAIPQRPRPKAPPLIVYEYPLSERIRTLLRLEDLFERARHFLAGENPLEHHVALLSLFEILEVASRADLKSDLLQELERQKHVLLAYRNNPQIAEDVLSQVITDMEQAVQSLFAMTGKIGQYLRENDWLMGIKSRAAIPGGVCEFDLPSYHHWLHREPEYRRAALGAWLKPLLPLCDGLSIVLRLLRASGRAEHHVAKGGAFQMMLGGSGAQMVRISLRRQEALVPEISANKYALNIRFSRPDDSHRPRHCDSDVNFDLVFCAL